MRKTRLAILSALLVVLAWRSAAQTALVVIVDNGAGSGVRLDGVTATYEAPVKGLNGRDYPGIARLTGTLQELQGVPVEAVEVLVRLEDPLGDKTRVHTIMRRGVEAGGLVNLAEDLEAEVENYRVYVRPVRIKRPGDDPATVVFPTDAESLPLRLPASDPSADLAFEAGTALWDAAAGRLRLRLTTRVTGVVAGEVTIVSTDELGDHLGAARLTVDVVPVVEIDLVLPTKPAAVTVSVNRVVLADGSTRRGRRLEVESRDAPMLAIQGLRGACSTEGCIVRYRLAVTSGAPVAAEIEVSLSDPFAVELSRSRRVVVAPLEQSISEELPPTGWTVVVAVQRVRLESGNLWERPLP